MNLQPSHLYTIGEDYLAIETLLGSLRAVATVDIQVADSDIDSPHKVTLTSTTVPKVKGRGSHRGLGKALLEAGEDLREQLAAVEETVRLDVLKLSIL